LFPKCPGNQQDERIEISPVLPPEPLPRFCPPSL
jgi:hypothetical protein